MGASLITKPAIEPVTLADAKAHLRVDQSDSDARIAALVVAARQHTEAYLRRALLNQTWAYSFDYGWPVDYDGANLIEIPMQPVQSVSSITYIDENGATQTLDTSQYRLYDASADSYAYVRPAPDVTWPTVQSIPETVIVSVVAGYGLLRTDVPAPIREAILLRVELLYDRNPQTRTLIDETCASLLDPYRVVRL